MNIGYVIGNGRSRANINLKTLEKSGKVYGCNALYRDFTPHVLVATDRPIAEAIQSTGYALKNTFYTRYPMPDQGAKPIPVKYFGYSSGPIAVMLAAQECDVVFLVGFDMGSLPKAKFNNIYANTEFYKTAKEPATFGGNWNKQLAKIIEENPNTVFFRVEDETCAPFALVAPLANVLMMSKRTFIEKVNKL